MNRDQFMVPDPRNTEFPFVAAANALKKIRKQRRTKKPLVWTGPDILNPVIGAVCPPPSVTFTEEHLAGSKECEGRGFWDEYTMVTYQLGYHNGYVRAVREQRAQHWEERYHERSDVLNELLAENRDLKAKLAAYEDTNGSK